MTFVGERPGEPVPVSWDDSFDTFILTQEPSTTPTSRSTSDPSYPPQNCEEPVSHHCGPAKLHDISPLDRERYEVVSPQDCIYLRRTKQLSGLPAEIGR